MTNAGSAAAGGSHPSYREAPRWYKFCESVIGPTRVHFAGVVWLLVRRELKVKYRGSMLGYLWSMLNPLLYMLTISFVFSHLFKTIENYSLYVLSGFLIWNLGSGAITMGTSALVRNASLLRKIKIPGWVFPSVALGSACVNFLLALIPYLILYAASGRPIPEYVWLTPIIFLIFVAFLCGVLMALSTMNVYFRDVSHVMEPVLGVVFYATPILYSREEAKLPSHIHTLIGFNPFTRFVEMFHVTMFGKGQITLADFAWIIGYAAVALVGGTAIYKYSKREIIFHI